MLWFAEQPRCGGVRTRRCHIRSWNDVFAALEHRLKHRVSSISVDAVQNPVGRKPNGVVKGGNANARDALIMARVLIVRLAN